MSTRAFLGIEAQPAAVDCMRAAAGLYVPNHAFRDGNANLYSGTKTGNGDGLSWNRTKYRGWYYHGADAGDAYGNYGGAKSPYGFLDASSLYIATDQTTATAPDFATNHRVLAATIHTDYIPFNRYFAAHYDKAITLALAAVVPADVTIGTNLKAFLACYDSDGALITAGTHGTPPLTEANPVELVFDDAGTTGTGDWQRLLASTAEVMPAGTAYVILHIGHNSPDSANTGLVYGDLSLMLNPANVSIAESSPVLFQDLDPVELRVGSAMAWEALGASSRVMLSGQRVRSVGIKDGLKARFHAVFTKISDEAYQELLTIWHLSTLGLGQHVPEPVPVCIDFGLGQLPFFGYYNVTRASFSGSFHPHWTLAGQGYDVALELEEA